MGLEDMTIAHFELTDEDDKSRYSVPEIVVPKPKDSDTMRLDMLEITFSYDPFGFSFANAHDND